MAKTQSELTEVELGHAYIERTSHDLDECLINQENALRVIQMGMDRMYTLTNQEANLRQRLDRQLDEYYQVMEPLDGIGTE